MFSYESYHEPMQSLVDHLDAVQAYSLIWSD